METLKNSSTRGHILKILGKQLRDEIKVMSSDQAVSILRSQNSDLLKQFNWKLLHNELKLHAPLLSSILNSVAKRKKTCLNANATVGICAAILINNNNSRMNLVQKIISLLLYAAGTSKQVNDVFHYCILIDKHYLITPQVYQRLSRLNITVSYSTVIRLLDTVGKDYDAEVKIWRDNITPLLDSTNVMHREFI